MLQYLFCNEDSDMKGYHMLEEFPLFYNSHGVTKDGDMKTCHTAE
jgi:hypothetical protein